MLSDEQLKEIEFTLKFIYEYGGDPSQMPTLSHYQNDPKEIPNLQQIIENPNSSNIMNHFALLSLRSLFEIAYKDWNEDTYLTYQKWCLQILFIKAESLELLSLDAFFKLYGVIFTCGFQLFTDFQLEINSIKPFLNSDKTYHIEIGLNLCSNILYAFKKIEDRLPISNLSAFFKETTMLTCYLVGSDIFNKPNLFSEINVIKYALGLLIDCLTFDEDITKETSMIFLPRTHQWNGILSNITTLLSTISGFYFSIDDVNEIRSKVLELIFHLTSVRLEYSLHIQYLNCVINIILQILETDPIFKDPNNISKINTIILKIILSIVSDDSSEIPLFEEFISAVFNYTMQFFDIETFASNVSDLLSLFKFWSKITISDQYQENYIKELTQISQSLYDTLISAASSNIDFISEFGFSLFSYISSFVYTIGLRNDRDFFKGILSNFELAQNELYETYKRYLSEEDNEADYTFLLTSLELKVTYSAMIISTPIIRIMNAHDDYLVGYSMSSLINFFINSQEKITTITRNYNSQNEKKHECLLTENVVTFLISRIERGSSLYLEKSFTSLAIENVPIKMVEELHSFFLYRLLSIAKFYQSDLPIMDTIFSSILSFYSLKLDDITNIMLVDTFLDGFLYNKMRLKPNKKTNIFQNRVWKNSERVKFHRIFSILMSRSAVNKSSFDLRKYNFMFYLRDIRERINLMNNEEQADLFLNDLYGLFRGIENSEVYSIMANYFFNSIPLFNKFKVNYHFILRFFAEFTENRFNRITNGSTEKVNDDNEPQSKSLRDLLIFKEAGSYLIDYFVQFQRSKKTFSVELKYVFRILSNIFSYYSTCIGAMKLYNDKVYESLFSHFVSTTCAITLEIKEYICYESPTARDIKLIFLIMKLIIILGNKENLFYDVYSSNNLFFSNILFMLNHLIMNPAFMIPDILSQIFEITNLLSKFFLVNKNNEIGSNLIVNQINNQILLKYIVANIFGILLKKPILLNITTIDIMANIFKLFPSKEYAEMLDDSISNLAQLIDNRNLFESLHNIHNMLVSE